MAAVLETKAKRWTYEKYYKLDDDQRYEIIGGKLLMAPAPDTWHQSWVGQLYALVLSFVEAKGLGRVFIPPIDVVLDQRNTVQPDLVFIASKNLEIIQRRAIFGTPDLLAEFLSPSSIRRDRYQKMKLYARFGVKEYWIGDPANRSFEILSLKRGKYDLLCSAEERGRLRSSVLTGFEFDLARIARHT
ncbi:MAG TPA: Uma2 family endonuclease [Verrucomicrobiae bacterium]|nr:Uma2 family endonuclease [Verrucomicrobiae bacterium]